MLKNLKLLLQLRAWLRSGTLKTGGAVALLGAIQTWLGSKDGIDALATVAGVVHLMPATLNGLVLGAIGLAILAMRAQTEWSLGEKVAGADQPKVGGSE